MSFRADKQTLDDLNLTGRYKPDSIFSLFNQTVTAGGGKLLEQLFLQPMSDAAEINRRCAMLSFFQDKKLTFPFDPQLFASTENYLGESVESNWLLAGMGHLKNQMLGLTVRDEQYALVQSGIRSVITLLHTLSDFIDRIKQGAGATFRKDAGPRAPTHPYAEQLQTLSNILNDPRLRQLRKENPARRLSLFKLTKYDHWLKHSMRREMEIVIQSIHYLDVCIAVSRVAAERDFSYATAFPKERNVFTAKELRHPAVRKAVGNDLFLKKENNVLFLTGANMAGKSTLMKAFGVSVYLAHMGFPVAARNMEFSIKDGLYSSINVADDLNMGYSHFYAEVLRVKTVAAEVSDGKEMIVLFDELFKGTNVKDAYDATLAVTEAFSAYRNCFFIVSTHIIEVGLALGKTSDSTQFVFLPTVMDGQVPTYTYTLKDGITADRQGMIIIENEGILELLQS
jgi:DNA mismatch repair ATPase MutS